MVLILCACKFAASKITEIVDEYKINLKGNTIVNKSNYKILIKFIVDNFGGLNKEERQIVMRTLRDSMDLNIPVEHELILNQLTLFVKNDCLVKDKVDVLMLLAYHEIAFEEKVLPRKEFVNNAVATSRN
jgi:hypothetical protein